MNPHSDLAAKLLAPAEKVKEAIGDIRASADLSYAEKLIASGITSKSDIMPWGSEIEAVAKEIRRIEKVREFFLGPIVEAKRAVELARKKQSAIFDEPISFLQSIKNKLSEPYGRFILRCKQEDEAAAESERQAKLKAARAEASSDFMADVAAEEIMAEPVKPPVTKVTTMTGSASVRFLDRVRLVDIGKVPKEYLLPNESKALADFKAGRVKEIPGLEFYKEPAMWVR